VTATHGWSEVESERKREILDAIRDGRATGGPVHAELDLTDRCNVACYFCNQQDVRTALQIPLDRVRALVAELAAGGLRSVRLSGGGDPLAYRGVAEVFDLLREHHVVIDNLTTNAALLTRELAERLVEPGRCREVQVSLNAVDAADYHRMMQVKPAIFDAVLANIRTLVELRGASARPAVTVQFLFDRENYARIPEMYELGRSLGVDRIAVNAVLDIPRERIESGRILAESEFELLRPVLEEVLRRDAAVGKLFVFFSYQSWNDRLEELRRRSGTRLPVLYETAPSFREENGGCFFAWYSATVRGNGDLYPCCMLMNPDYKPLGNVVAGPPRFQDHWQGPAFGRLRDEMRDVLLAGGRILWSRDRFRHLEPQCVSRHACGLKNMYFRGDAEFYRELGGILEERRRQEIGWRGGWRGLGRRLEIFRFRLHHGLRTRARPTLRRLAARLAGRGRWLDAASHRLGRV